MACSTRTIPFFFTLQEFPHINSGRINFVVFLKAVDDLVSLVVVAFLYLLSDFKTKSTSITARLGKSFAPVKYDMQGNIDKIKKYYIFDEASCLLELMLEEINNNKCIGAEAVLWLNRAILFFELIFQEIIKCLQTSYNDVNMTTVYTVAYEGSVKKYHNWITQKIFALICKMSPTLPQLLQSLEVINDMVSFESKLTDFNSNLKLVRCEIDNFFKGHNLFQD